MDPQETPESTLAAHPVAPDPNESEVKKKGVLFNQEFICPHTNIAGRRLLTCRGCGKEFNDELPPGDFVLMPRPDYNVYLEMKHEQDEIALFLRNNYQEEIAKGEHSGASLSQTLIRYLSKERRAAASAIGFFSQFFKGGGKTN